MGALVLAALGWRAWDRGVVSSGRGPPYAAWAAWRGCGRDGALRPLRAAILAASPHDTQPWLFQVSDGAITVYADRTRHLGSFDPFRREMQLGLGCAIENLVLAARALHLQAKVHTLPGRLEPSPPAHPLPVAHVALTSMPAAPPNPGVHARLFEAIPHRATHRGPYLEQPIDPVTLGSLGAHVGGENVRCVFVTERGARAEMADVIVRATERIVGDREMSTDNARWVRTGRRDILAHRDGVTMDTSAGPWVAAAAKMLPDLGEQAVGRFWLNATRRVQVATAAAFGMILVRDRFDMAQAIDAGRAWQRLHLAATACGLAAQPLNQPVEMMDRHRVLGRVDEFAPGLAALAASAGWEPTFAFRLGHARRAAPRAPRRPLGAVVMARS